jgi:hypothetical protein
MSTLPALAIVLLVTGCIVMVALSLTTLVPLTKVWLLGGAFLALVAVLAVTLMAGKSPFGVVHVAAGGVLAGAWWRYRQIKTPPPPPPPRLEVILDPECRCAACRERP